MLIPETVGVQKLVTLAMMCFAYQYKPEEGIDLI